MGPFFWSLMSGANSPTPAPDSPSQSFQLPDIVWAAFQALFPEEAKQCYPSEPTKGGEGLWKVTPQTSLAHAQLSYFWKNSEKATLPITPGRCVGDYQGIYSEKDGYFMRVNDSVLQIVRKKGAPERLETLMTFFKTNIPKDDIVTCTEEGLKYLQKKAPTTSRLHRYFNAPPRAQVELEEDGIRLKGWGPQSEMEACLQRMNAWALAHFAPSRQVPLTRSQMKWWTRQGCKSMKNPQVKITITKSPGLLLEGPTDEVNEVADRLQKALADEPDQNPTAGLGLEVQN